MTKIKTPYTDAIEMSTSGVGSSVGAQLTGVPGAKGNNGSGGAGEPVKFVTIAHMTPSIPADLDERGYVISMKR